MYKSTNTLTINYISFQGSNLGGGISCHRCPYGKIIDPNSNSTSCTTCEKGKTSNEDSNLFYFTKNK